MDNAHSFYAEGFGEVTLLFIDKKLNEIVINGITYSKFDLLALAARRENKKSAIDILQLASKLFHWQDDPTFNTIYGAVAMLITMENIENEATIYSLFSKNVKNVLGEDVAIVKRKNDNRHIPDFWVETKNGVIPIEIKYRDFNLKALHQLSRYISFYGATGGIAVGRNLTVELPENITFVSIEALGG